MYSVIFRGIICLHATQDKLCCLPKLLCRRQCSCSSFPMETVTVVPHRMHGYTTALHNFLQQIIPCFPKLDRTLYCH